MTDIRQALHHAVDELTVSDLATIRLLASRSTAPSPPRSGSGVRVMTMHAARLDQSDRLQRVLSVLEDGGEHSTLDLVMLAGVCAVNSTVAELRANGIAIDCRQTKGANGDRLWLYRLKGRNAHVE